LKNKTFRTGYWKTPEVHRSNHNLTDYCTYKVETANDAGIIQVTQFVEKITTTGIYQT